MRQLTYTTTFITGDAIAEAVLDYAHALASAGLTDRISVPTVDATGKHGTTDVLLSPTHGLVSTPYETVIPELEDEEFIGSLAERQLLSPIARFMGPAQDDDPDAWEHPGF